MKFMRKVGELQDKTVGRQVYNRDGNRMVNESGRGLLYHCFFPIGQGS